MSASFGQKQIDRGLADLLQRNVETVAKLELGIESQRTRADVIADAIASFCGTIVFVYVHCILIVGWILWNLPWFTPRSMRFDPPPFPLLGTIVSIEAIFLATFILISQNRQQRVADRRNMLDLQINMLAEQENSQMLGMLQQIMEHVGAGKPSLEVEILQQATDPEFLASQIEQTMETSDATSDPGHAGSD
ncbi:MAG: hypothetical protein QOJ65_1878 [Fimbriimonadaceae bacterium]|jgi:uncharacterized membrane protein|nr:hypothetical protein [Fimbriimonadaceae bacterium]